jgi:hypothetical protein
VKRVIKRVKVFPKLKRAVKRKALKRRVLPFTPN